MKIKLFSTYHVIELMISKDNTHQATQEDNQEINPLKKTIYREYNQKDNHFKIYI